MASMENSVQNILDESIEQANRSLESQELLKQAQDMVIKNEKVDKDTAPISRITVLGGVLWNKTKGSLSVMDEHKYAGHFLTGYPNPLKVTGNFGMSALSNKGVKAAVVYSGKNKQGVECGWLLAFADTKNTGRRIYGECGAIDKFANIDWAQVETNLNNAGAVAEPSDQATGTSLYARIVGSSGKSAVGGVFSG
ncbi:hypothetical protein EJB05_02448 [Eragrostis curvula]|uniref:Uncharacterized protein n=1 Tax=Eragrostis curvula TaxID=38414 RepID=A0A5J9WUY7_9POAL|nr:hypothetical protein EJB05_02406 [Eragrostis curvula]TVU51044.1 hypothetical protein EJB05_02448 [Eragrostis curvula]